VGGTGGAGGAADAGDSGGGIDFGSSLGGRGTSGGTDLPLTGRRGGGGNGSG